MVRTGGRRWAGLLPSTVSREIKRNSGHNGRYNWETAQRNVAQYSIYKHYNYYVVLAFILATIWNNFIDDYLYGMIALLFLGREELSPCELSHFGCDGGVSGDCSSTVVNGSVGYGSAYGYGCVAWDVAYGAVEIVAGREERTILGIGVVASRLLVLSLWPGVETVVDVTTFSEVVLEVVGCFPSNLNWESSVYGFCNFSLLFLYFSFKIVNVHNIFEGFVWGLGKYC